MQDIVDILYKYYRENLGTDLEYINEFTFIISVILSARTRDEQVNKVTKKLFLIVKTPQDILDIGLEKLELMISSIGLYRNKAKNIFELSKILSNKEIPNSMKELIKLPGIGRKSANVILNHLFGQYNIAVDTHVFRVARRIGLSNGKTKLAVEKDLMKIGNKQLHNILIRHGKTICKSRTPACSICPINLLCKRKDV